MTINLLPTIHLLFHALGPPGYSGNAGAGDFDEAQGHHEGNELFDLVAFSGDLENEAGGAGINDAGAEGIGEAERFDTPFTGACDFHHGEFAGQRITLCGQVGDRMHRHHALKLMFDLGDDGGRAAGDNGDARDVLLVLRFRHGKRVDIIAAARKQADDTGQYAGLVIDDDGESVGLDFK